MEALTITEHTPTHPDFLLKPNAPKFAQDLDDLIRSLQPTIRDHGYLRFETLQMISVAMAKWRGYVGDASDPAIAASWMIEYLLEYVIQVQGVCALAQYTGNPEAARMAGLPQAYALIATAWPELAPYCPTISWDGTRGLFVASVAVTQSPN